MTADDPAGEYVVKKSRSILVGILVILGIVILSALGTLWWQVAAGGLRAEPLVGVITDNQRLVPFKGQNLRGGILYVYTVSGSIPEEDQITLRLQPGNALAGRLNLPPIPTTAQAILTGIERPQYTTVDLSPVWDMLRNGDRLRFEFVRASFFRPLVPRWLTYQCVTEVAVHGSLLPISMPQQRTEHEPFPMLYQLYEPVFKPDEIVRLPGEDYGMERGTVSLDNKPIPVIHWTDTEIIFRIPETAKPGENIVFTITRKDNVAHKFLATIEAPSSAPPVPQLDKTAMPPVTAGQTVRVTGDALGTPGTVTFGNQAADISFWSDHAVAFTVPDNVPPGLRKVVITRADKQSVSFFARVKSPVVAKVTPSPDAVALLLEGYRKLKAGDADAARAGFDQAVALTKTDSAEGMAMRAITRLMNDPADADALELAQKASQLAKTPRARALAYLATGWDPDFRQNWTLAKNLGDPQVKELVEMLLSDHPDTDFN